MQKSKEEILIESGCEITRSRTAYIELDRVLSAMESYATQQTKALQEENEKLEKQLFSLDKIREIACDFAWENRLNVQDGYRTFIKSFDSWFGPLKQQFYNPFPNHPQSKI